MAARTHRVVLVDAAGRIVAGPVTAPGEWPSPADLRHSVAAPGAPGAVEADDAVEVVPPWLDGTVDDAPDGVGIVTRLLRTRTRPGAGAPWPPAVAALALRERGGDGWPAWYLPGWRAQVDAWVHGILAEHRLAPAGPAEIITWWSLSAVLRFPVARGDGAPVDVWFKATCDGFRAEAEVTAHLAGLGGGPLPGVLAVDTARAWMLLHDIPGAGDEPGLATVVAAATAMAELQVRLVGAPLPVPVRDAAATIAALQAVVDDSVEAPLMSPALRAAARAALPGLAGAVRALDEIGVPETLVHGDLHTQNLAGSPRHPIIFDWTDACRAHPYLDGRLLTASAVSRHADGAGAERVARAVRDAFLAPWRRAYPDLDHDRAWELAGTVNDIFQVVSYEGILRAQAPASRWELGGILTAKLARLVGLGEARDADAPA